MWVAKEPERLQADSKDSDQSANVDVCACVCVCVCVGGGGWGGVCGWALWKAKNPRSRLIDSES